MAQKKTAKQEEEEKSFQEVLVKQLVTLATSGFGLVAALAWNSVVQEFVNSYIKRWLPKGSGIFSLLIYALAITGLAVFVTYQLSKLARRIEKR